MLTSGQAFKVLAALCDLFIVVHLQSLDLLLVSKLCLLQLNLQQCINSTLSEVRTVDPNNTYFTNALYIHAHVHVSVMTVPHYEGSFLQVHVRLPPFVLALLQCDSHRCISLQLGDVVLVLIEQVLHFLLVHLKIEQHK